MVCGLVPLAAPAQASGHSHGAPMKQDAAPVDCDSIRAMNDHGNMDHAAHIAALKACEASSLPTLPGQAAFGAIAEVVRLLEADSTTDWSKVNIEALRQHLIDMDAVTMRARFSQRNVAGGIEVDVTGSGATVDAIKRMVVNQSRMIDMSGDMSAASRELPNGEHVTITAKNPGDARLVSKIRGLGFAGLMTEGDHHVRHHMAIARGEPDPHRR
jgi:hypothetical protein